MADLLLVDNDARIADLVAFFLRRSGHAVRTSADFGGARAAIAHARPDLMLSDLDLGEERGLVELPRLAADGLLPPTLVVSGFLDRAAQIELERLPQVVGVLAKPFDLDVLLARVAEALARARERAPTAVASAGDDGWLELAPSPESA
ncbi:MAG: response regulator [Planctomycetota bacterium]|nr:response regulator [Planctomycetota bacterium]